MEDTNYHHLITCVNLEPVFFEGTINGFRHHSVLEYIVDF